MATPRRVRFEPSLHPCLPADVRAFEEERIVGDAAPPERGFLQQFYGDGVRRCRRLPI